MTMLQEQAVQMIQDMSDDNVGFLIEVIQRLIPKKTYHGFKLNPLRTVFYGICSDCQKSEI